MKSKQKVNNPPQFLSGWKDIANYLGKGVRTVQRYEREFGLPVRRPAGKPWGSVLATKPELDAWIMASPIREAFHLSRPAANLEDATGAAIKKGLETMSQLRDQMLALRAEVRASVQTLRGSVHDLQGQLNPGRWHESISGNPAARDSLSKSIFEEAGAEPTRRKAS